MNNPVDKIVRGLASLVLRRRVFAQPSFVKTGRLGGLLTLGTVALAVSLPSQVDAATTLTVECGTTLRGVTHCASGSLYGITESKPADISGLVAPLKPCVFVNPPRAGSQYQKTYGAGLTVARRISGTTGKVMLRLADLCPGWPYQWPGSSTWINNVTSVINDKRSSGLSNIYGYEIWNEPKGTWNTANGDFNTVLWKPTYSKIRSLDPGALIIGPSYALYNSTDMNNFLTFCKNNSCLPDVISWHELSLGISSVAGHLRNYRSIESSLGISARKISINEYCDNNHDLEGQPGSCALFIAKFERYKVDNAAISFWHEAGRLGSLLATDTGKGAGWFFFNMYAGMSGNMVKVTPPNEDSANLDGFCSVDSGAKVVTLLCGGANDGTITATFKSVPSFIGANARFVIDRAGWTSRTTVSGGTYTMSTQTKAVSSGQVSVTFSGANANAGYRIRMTPG
jgi:hypothetical protein